MSDQTSHDDRNLEQQENRNGFRSADVLAILAVASFLAAIGLVTFFVTTALAN